MDCAHERAAPVGVAARGEKAFQVLAAVRGEVGQDRGLGLGRARNQVQCAAECRAAVEGGSRALDDFDALKVQGWCLEQAEAIGLCAEHWQSVGQYQRVSY